MLYASVTLLSVLLTVLSLAGFIDFGIDPRIGIGYIVMLSSGYVIDWYDSHYFAIGKDNA